MGIGETNSFDDDFARFVDDGGLVKSFGNVNADNVHINTYFRTILRLLQLKTCFEIRRRSNIRLIIENPQVRVFTLE